jgi:sialate O-acetylesterase
MEQPVSGSWCPVRNHEQEVKDANYPKIRLLGVQRTTATVPKDDFATYGDGWQECSPESIPEFSATAYFFGRELFLEMGVPVGLIHSSWGGTVIEAWMTKDALAGIKDLAEMAEELATWPADKPELKSRHPHTPTVLYNSMIEPLVPFAIKGAIWYQGCSNTERAYQYQDLMRLMIDDWRHLWGYDFPFYITQLANFTERQTEPCESSWAELREAQAMAAQLVPDTGMAVTIDIGEADDIHPRNKQDVGKRLALQAMNKTYGMKVICDGPVYEGYEVDGNVIRIHFSSVAKGLVANGDKLEGFTIAGADHKFHWADAKIVGDCVEVSCKDVPRPLAVRYAWANNPLGNLYNTAGLPASPFRTDAWPGVTCK